MFVVNRQLSDIQSPPPPSASVIQVLNLLSHDSPN